MTQLLEEVSFTDGKIYVKGKPTARGDRKRADYILFYKPNIPIAIIEAKDNKHSVRAGLQQALDYAEILDIPCVFSSNGDGFVFHNRVAYTGSMDNLENMEVLKVKPLTDFGSAMEIVSYFGGKQQYLEAVKEQEQEIYKAGLECSFLGSQSNC
jgi:type I site-specific restriction endonuclease